VICVAIVVSVFNNKLDAGLSSVSFSGLPEGVIMAIFSGDAQIVQNLPDPPRYQVISAFVAALQWAFRVCIPFAGCMLITSLFIIENKMQSKVGLKSNSDVEAPPPMIE